MQLEADVNDPSAILSSFAQSRLRINDGGLGLGLLDVPPQAAYLASIVACLPCINKYEKGFIPSLLSTTSDEDYLMINDVKAAVSTINYCNYDMAMILPLSGLNLQSGEHRDDAITTKLQHTFMEPHYEVARTAFSQSLLSLPNAVARIAQYTSVCGQEAGAAILAAPKTPALTFLPQEYRIMLRRRFHLNLLQIPDGLRCNCSSHPVIDRKGRHVVTVCKQGQGRHIIHDGFKQELASLCRYAEVYVRQEPTDVYRGVDVVDRISRFVVYWSAEDMEMFLSRSPSRRPSHSIKPRTRFEQRRRWSRRRTMAMHLSLKMQVIISIRSYSRHMDLGALASRTSST
jgi:hypothetical protein